VILQLPCVHLLLRSCQRRQHLLACGRRLGRLRCHGLEVQLRDGDAVVQQGQGTVAQHHQRGIARSLLRRQLLVPCQQHLQQLRLPQARHRNLRQGAHASAGMLSSQAHTVPRAHRAAHVGPVACPSAHLLVQARHLGHGAVVGLLQLVQQLQVRLRK
jgi:hypothetical protein